ncbi:MAG TPA: catalase [Tepidisphaeraceae bacterium]|jgi:catalase|nr:catalase [Tepidisphaeraceae bacterium]
MSAKKATGRSGGKDNKATDLERDTAAPGEHLTTNQGLRIADDQNVLKGGVRGPSLLEDFHFREKITHFDHERIPERVVHARGTAAHGYFQVYKPIPELTKAAIFQDPAVRTPVFVRFSTVAGSRGSADTPRDVRGFAVKFYTTEGVWDLVGNNMPVFFIQDAIKFPDFVHAVKPEPHNEIPQAASAHDTFWDFVSLTPESMHMLMWVMSDRALPRSLAMMEGFGIHTFRLINTKGKSRFVKFHWKPVKGVHSLVWDEAQKVAGKDPDFNRRDLYDSIERGDFPAWEMGLQVVEEKDEHKFDFDLLDPTKIIPEELVPVQRIGKMVLNRNPDNFFAETEQAAFHPGHVVPGIDFSNDPLLQGRLFSYIDTQIKRVGPNFAQLPINRPTCPFSNNQRDGESQQLIHKGRVAYFPNSLGNGCPAHSPEGMAAFSSYAEKMDGAKVRQRSPSFADHFSQATLFWNSMAGWEKEHIAAAFSFELNMVQTKAVQERVLNELLANVADELAEKVGLHIGMKPQRRNPTGITPEASAPPPKKSKGAAPASPALSMDKPADGIKGRKIAILAADGVDAKQVAQIKSALAAEGALAEVIARFAGTIKAHGGEDLAVDKPAPNAPSVMYDAVFIPGGQASVATLAASPLAMEFVTEAYKHFKPIGAFAEGVDFLSAAEINGSDNAGKIFSENGVVTASGKDLGAFSKAFIQAIVMHRHFDREAEM